MVWSMLSPRPLWTLDNFACDLQLSSEEMQHVIDNFCNLQLTTFARLCHVMISVCYHVLLYLDLSSMSSILSCDDLSLSYIWIY